MFTHQATAVRINISALFSIQNPNYAPKNNADSFLYRAICCVFSHKNRQLLEQILAKFLPEFSRQFMRMHNTTSPVASVILFDKEAPCLKERASLVFVGLFSAHAGFICNGDPEQHLFFGKQSPLSNLW